jgi:hypothetical protein
MKPDTCRAAAMPKLNDIDVLRVLHQAFDRAVGSPVDLALPRGRQNSKRSQNWVTCLRNELHTVYRGAGHQDVRAFCKECRDNRREFGLNELLHDVGVCRVATVQSRVHGRSIAYVQDVLWQVESEFKNSGTETVKDFNKLILGAAQNKLFVGPLSDEAERNLRILVEPAKYCGGTVYVGFIEHPGRWTTNPRRPCLYRFDAARLEWRAIGERFVT